MINVLHYTPHLGLDHGGPPRSVSAICNELTNYCNVSLYSDKNRSENIVHISDRVSLYSDEEFSRNDLLVRLGVRFYTPFNKIAEEKNIDIYHQHNIWAKKQHDGVNCIYNKSIPIIISPRGSLEPWALQYKKFKKWVAWKCYQKRDLLKATAFHATSEMEASSIRSLGFKQPIAVIPNGVYMPQVASAGSFSHSSATKRSVLFLSRLHPKKGILMLIEAWAKLRPENWSLIVAGNSQNNHVSEIRELVTKLKCTDSIEILGPVYGQDKADAFRSSKIFILPSYSENFGIVVAEALSYGLPVITTTGTPWKILGEKNCGWWVTPSVDGLAGALRCACSAEEADIIAMGQRGKTLIEEQFQWSAIADKMHGFYRWILHGGSKPDYVV